MLLFFPVGDLFLFYLIVVWALCTLVGIVYHFRETTGIVYLFSEIIYGIDEKIALNRTWPSTTDSDSRVESRALPN